ncbi:hypothetical protein Tco_0321393 [Tanacetum coccineum]
MNSGSSRACDSVNKNKALRGRHPMLILALVVVINKSCVLCDSSVVVMRFASAIPVLVFYLSRKRMTIVKRTKDKAKSKRTSQINVKKSTEKSTGQEGKRRKKRRAITAINAKVPPQRAKAAMSLICYITKGLVMQ